jgi:hypothetical protein
MLNPDHFLLEKAQYLNQNITLTNLSSKVDKALVELKGKVKDKEAKCDKVLQEIRLVKTAIKQRMANLAQQLNKVAKEIESITGIQKSHKRRGSMSDYGLTTIGQTIPKKKDLDTTAMYGTPVLSEPNLLGPSSDNDSDDGIIYADKGLGLGAESKVPCQLDEISSDSFQTDEEDELNQHAEKEPNESKPIFPQNFHIGMDFKKKSAMSSRRETIKDEKNKAEPSSTSLPLDAGSNQGAAQYHLDAGLEYLLQTAQQLKSELMSLKDWLISINSRMRLFNLTAQSKMNEIFTCKNCFQKYRLTDNQPGGCMYHSGKLRYLSCIECSSLEYYTCCRVCSKCKPGCNTSLHSPLVQYSIMK